MPPRQGEGTCQFCDPEGVEKHTRILRAGMIYSREDVKRMLAEIKEVLDGHKKCRPWDCSAIKDKIEEIEGKVCESGPKQAT